MACQNTNGKYAEEEYKKLKSEQFSDYVELPWWKTFRDEPKSFNRPKLIIKAWYWRGAWCDPTKEIYRRLYLPA